MIGFVLAAWVHYYQRDAEFSASLNGLPGASFPISGARPDRNATLLAAGLDVKLSQSVSLGARIDGESSENTRRLGGTAQLQISFLIARRFCIQCQVSGRCAMTAHGALLAG